MSCATLNQTSIELNVSVASLPEGFCPATMQELANAIGARIIISPSANFNTFATGSTAPTSNVGPWLKDCTAWFVFDDATASYVPTTKGGFDTFQYFTTSGTFIVPSFIYKLKISAWGGGGGGMQIDGSGAASGGGGGSFGQTIMTVTPGQVIPYSIGAGGAGGTGGASSPGANGGATTILALTAGGGLGATTVLVPGKGGTATGFTRAIVGGTGNGNGSGAAAGASRNGGASPNGGSGGGDSNTPADRGGIVPGGGGAGGMNGTSSTGSTGGSGAILVEY